MKVRLSSTAKKSLKSIEEHTKTRWGTTQKRKYRESLYHKFNFLAENPLIGRQCEGMGNVRSYVDGSYMIYYIRKNTHLEIVDILHQRMNPKERLH